jgi:hypothetical protein
MANRAGDREDNREDSLDLQISAVTEAARLWLELAKRPEHAGAAAATFRACARDIEEALR